MIYNKIRELREDNDLSQKEIAKILSCTQTAYSNWEIGKRIVPIEVLLKLADYYNVTVDYLLGREEKKTIQSHNQIKGNNNIIGNNNNVIGKSEKELTQSDISNLLRNLANKIDKN